MVESHLVSKHYGVYVMYNDDDHDLIYDGEPSWKYPSHQQATDRVWSHQFGRYINKVELQSLVLLYNSLPVVFGKVLLGLNC